MTNNVFINSNFSILLNKKLQRQPKKNTIVNGQITSIIKDTIFIDVGLKTEGAISRKEFFSVYKSAIIGKNIDIYIEELEDKNGHTILSIDKVIKEKIWKNFEYICKEGKNIKGKIIGKVSKGGFAVEINSVLAFLPGSQLDVKPIRDHSALFNSIQSFRILKLDRKQGNIVVSRRAIIEESYKEERENLLSVIREGTKLRGTVKNMTPYGAFIDLGYIDGLLHINDINWNKISHPTEVLSIGQKVRVVVTKYNLETRRVSLGMKQLHPNTWLDIHKKYIVGGRYNGLICEFCNYGIFVELNNGVKGLVHINEVSWNLKNIIPKELYKLGDLVDVLVLDVDIDKHRISLSLKRCKPNPWEIFSSRYKLNQIVEVEVVKILHFGILVNVVDNSKRNDLNLLLPAIEMDMNNSYKNARENYSIGTRFNAVISSKDISRERITVSIKKCNDMLKISSSKYLTKETIHTCKVLKITEKGLLILLDNLNQGFVDVRDLSNISDLHKFSVGDMLRVKFIAIDKDNTHRFSFCYYYSRSMSKLKNRSTLGYIIDSALINYKKNNIIK